MIPNYQEKFILLGLSYLDLDLIHECLVPVDLPVSRVEKRHLESEGRLSGVQGPHTHRHVVLWSSIDAILLVQTDEKTCDWKLPGDMRKPSNIFTFLCLYA